MTRKFLPALCIFALVICALPVLAASGVQVNSNAIVNYPVRADVSAPLSSYPTEKITASSHVHAPLKPKAQQLRAQGAVSGHGLGRATGVLGPLVGISFDALSGDPGSPTAQNCPLAENNQVAPPDTNAAVGDTQVVEWVNLCYAVYDKATGNLIAGPFAGNHFWAGFWWCMPD